MKIKTKLGVFHLHNAESNNQIWQVCDINTRRVIYETDDLEEVIEWAINNYEQYKNRIVSYNKNNDYERNYI